MSDEPQPAPDPQEASRRLARTFRDDLSAADLEAPSFEEVAAYAEGRLAGDARLLFEERLAGDPLLRAEVEDLRRLRREMDAARRPAVPEWTRWAAAALAVASVAGWLWLRPPRGPSEQAARSGGAAGAPASSVPAEPAAVARLQDTSGPIALRADGTVEGVPGGLRSRVADALRSGTLRVPALRSDLAVSPVTAMGPDAPAAVFGPTAPLSTATLDDRPTFRWSRHPRARAYVVSVYDLDLEPVAVSPRLSGHEWTPAQALPRGRTYLWQVEADTAAGRETAPLPPAPEARFHVAAADVERGMRELLAQAGGSHLAAAVALAEAGFLDEAAGELDRLAALNPGSEPVARLRDSLSRSRRR